MTTLVKSIFDVITESENLSLEAAALSLKPNKNVDRCLILAGLESATSLRETISQEGIISWIMSRVRKLGRKITISVNKIYAKLTSASANTKALIRRAERDDSVRLGRLPISGFDIALLTTLTTVAAVVITKMLAISYDNGKFFAETAAKYKAEYEEWQKEADKYNAQRNYHEANFARQAGRFAYNEAKDYKSKVEANKTYKTLKPFVAALDSLKKLFPNIIRKFKDISREAEEVKTDGTVATSTFERLKLFGLAIVRIFSVIRKWFSCLPNCFKRKSNSNPNNLPVLYNNLEPY